MTVFETLNKFGFSVFIIALIVLAIYTMSGMLVGKATAIEHISGFAGGLLMGLIFVVI